MVDVTVTLFGAARSLQIEYTYVARGDVHVSQRKRERPKLVSRGLRTLLSLSDLVPCPFTLTAPHWTVQYFDHEMRPLEINNLWHDGKVHLGSWIHIYPRDLEASLQLKETNRLGTNEGNARLEELGESRVF